MSPPLDCLGLHTTLCLFLPFPFLSTIAGSLCRVSVRRLASRLSSLTERVYQQTQTSTPARLSLDVCSLLHHVPLLASHLFSLFSLFLLFLCIATSVCGGYISVSQSIQYHTIPYFSLSSTAFTSLLVTRSSSTYLVLHEAIEQRENKMPVQKLAQRVRQVMLRHDGRFLSGTQQHRNENEQKRKRKGGQERRGGE